MHVHKLPFGARGRLIAFGQKWESFGNPLPLNGGHRSNKLPSPNPILLANLPSRKGDDVCRVT
jgi:hypothetical protein